MNYAKRVSWGLILLLLVGIGFGIAGERLSWQTQQGVVQMNISDKRASIAGVGFCLENGNNCPSALSGFHCAPPNSSHTFVVNSTAASQCVPIPTSGAGDGNNFLTSVSATNDSGSHTFNFSVSGQPDILVTINDQTSAGGGDPTGVVSVQAVDASLIVVNATTANFSVNTTHLDTLYLNVDGDNATGTHRFQTVNVTVNHTFGCIQMFYNGSCGITENMCTGSRVEVC